MIDFPAQEKRIGQRVSSPVGVLGGATGHTVFPLPIGIEVIDHIRDRLTGIACIGRGGLGRSRLTSRGYKAHTNSKCGQECFVQWSY